MSLKKVFFFTVLLSFAFFNSNAQTASNITIDYAIDRGESKQVASGLLHGISDGNPAQYLIDGIKVRAVRGADYHANLPSFYEQPIYDRTMATGAKLMIGLYYYRANDSYFPGDGNDYVKWETICKDVYNEAQTKNLDIYSWITWNEPRLQWGNSAANRNRYFKAHDVAYKTVKSINPQARIQAPEDHYYDFIFMQEFLNYCKTNNCLPDVLSWHELSPNPLDIEGHCAELKTWMEANGITPMPMTVTEYQGSSYSDDNTSIPGVNVYYLASMERAVQYGFEFGLHACWTRTGGDPNFIATLADMADSDYANLPRGLWWNYNAYKDMTGRKVGVNVVGENGDALASSDSYMKRSVILIGTRNYITPHDVSITLDNIPDYLKHNGKVNIRVELISNAMVLTNPEVVIVNDFAITNNAVSLDLPQMAGKNSYAIYVSPATSDATVLSYEVENLTIKDVYSTGSSPYNFNESIASDGTCAALDANAIGDYVEYTIPAPGAGVYNLSAILKGDTNKGFVQLYIDGIATCPPEDLYKGTNLYYKNDFGNIEIGTEDLNLRFEVIGQNPLTSGHKMMFDRIDLKLLQAGNLGEEDIATDIRFNVYPNPTSDIINIDIDKNFALGANLYFYDYTGRVVFKDILSKNRHTVDLSNLSSGMYLLKVVNKGRTVIKRISKR